jgi:hypothetical protein
MAVGQGMGLSRNRMSDSDDSYDNDIIGYRNDPIGPVTLLIKSGVTTRTRPFHKISVAENRGSSLSRVLVIAAPQWGMFPGNRIGMTQSNVEEEWQHYLMTGSQSIDRSSASILHSIVSPVPASSFEYTQCVTSKTRRNASHRQLCILKT